MGESAVAPSVGADYQLHRRREGQSVPHQMREHGGAGLLLLEQGARQSECRLLEGLNGIGGALRGAACFTDADGNGAADPASCQLSHNRERAC